MVGGSARARVLALAFFSGLAGGLAAEPRPEEEPLQILHADRLPADRGQQTMVLEGHVRLRKGETDISGERVTWDRSKRTLDVRGGVRVVDATSRLACDHLLYDLDQEAVTAWGRPRIEQRPVGDIGDTIVLTAVQLRLFPSEGRIEAIEDVLVEQLTRASADARQLLTMRVTCRVAEILARGKRNVFKGDVEVETPDIGAEAGRMLYEQESRRVYLLDGARVWNYDSGGRKLDELRGDKVIHMLNEGRTIALGGVRATVHPDATSGTRVLPRSRRALAE